MKKRKRKTNKFQEWKKDFNEADYTYLYDTTYSCLTIRMSQKNESLINPKYLVEKVGEYTEEARVSDRQRRPRSMHD